jgi:hypothetical protein
MRTYDGQGIANTIAPSADYPTGRAQNETTPGVSGDGTPFVEDVSGGGDLYQAMTELIRRAGITLTEAPEKKEDSDINRSLNKLYFPRTMLTVQNGVVIEEIGTDLNYTFAEGAFLGATNSRQFTLNITDAGNYIVEATLSDFTPFTTDDAGTSFYITIVRSEHNSVSGYFENNTLGNIITTTGTVPTAVSTAAQVPASFILNVYKVDADSLM